MVFKSVIWGCAAWAALLASGGEVRAATVEAVASFTILADVVGKVGGEHVRVTSLVAPDADPHDFEPSPDDAKALKGAQLVFLNGLGLEDWFERLARASGFSGTVVAVSAGVATLGMKEDEHHDHDHDHGHDHATDPHVWNSPRNVLVWVDAIETALVAADPADADAIRVNAENYRKDLRALDAYAKERIGAVAPERRKVLTSHEAFGYFARDYGVTFLSPLGVSTGKEASAATVAKLIKQIKREGVKTYFLENSSDPRLVEQIAKATGAKPGGRLYVESLSAADGPAPDYQALFRHNVDLIADAIAK